MCVHVCVGGGGWSLNPTHSPVGLLMNTSSAGGDLVMLVPHEMVMCCM